MNPATRRRAGSAVRSKKDASGSIARARLCLVAAVSLFAAPAVLAGERPNIILFLADDLGWRDTAVTGSSFYETPNIDSLASAGMSFTNAYAASPVCSPTRASLLTGRYPARLRFTTPAGHLPEAVVDPDVPERTIRSRKVVTPRSRTRLPNEERTIAETLGQAGYATAFFGKWHLGRAPYLPSRQGFGTVAGGGHHPSPPGGYFTRQPLEGLPDEGRGRHVTDRLAEEAARFIRANRGRPFFICFWDYSVHTPLEAKPELVDRFSKKADPEARQNHPVMAAMIHTMDQAVGTLRSALSEAGIAEKTVFILTSDNGGSVKSDGGDRAPTSNAPLRDGKGSIYEGGIRVPLIVSWPGRIPKDSHSSDIVTSVDFFPTVLDILGLERSPKRPPDGVSLLTVLLGTGKLEREAVFWHVPHYLPDRGLLPSTAVRAGRWKLIRFYGDGPGRADRFELYDLNADVGESNDLAPKQPALVARLNGLIDKHLTDTRALVPRINPAYEPGLERTGGWWGNKRTSVELRDKALVMRSSGGASRIRVTDLPAFAGPARLSLRVKSERPGQGRVFWATRDRRTFDETRSAPFRQSLAGSWERHELVLNFRGWLTTLAIEVSGEAGAVALDEIELRDPGGLPVMSWSFSP